MKLSITSNGRMTTVEMNRKGYGRTQSWNNSRYYRGLLLYLEGPKEIKSQLQWPTFEPVPSQIRNNIAMSFRRDIRSLGFIVVMQPAELWPQETFVTGGYIDSLYSLVERSAWSYLMAFICRENFKLYINHYNSYCSILKLWNPLSYFTIVFILLQHTGL
jgi:hypothetical protein